MLEFETTVNIGDRVRNLWNGELGSIAMSCELRRTGGSVVVRWDNTPHKTCREVWLCDVEPLERRST